MKIISPAEQKLRRKKIKIYALSRKKNIIRRNGITIYPEDIENVILQNKNIKDIFAI